jgi:hypothetical protein
MFCLYFLDPIWVSAIAAVVYALFTGLIIWEMNKDRKLAYKPMINVIFNDSSSHYPNQLAFDLKNVGKGPALDLKFECKDNQGNHWQMKREILPIGSLETVTIIVVLKEEVKEFGTEVFLEIKYKDIFNRIHGGKNPVPRELYDLLCTMN